MKAQSAKTGMSGLLLACLVGLVVVAFSAYYIDRSSSDEQGSIEFGDVQLRVHADILELQTNANVQLPANVQSGLYSGVPLTFVLEFEVQQPRPFWFPASVFSAKIHYTVTYYELTRHYRVSAVESNVSRNFRSLSSALSGLGDLGTLRFSLKGEQQKALSISRRDKQQFVGSLSMRLSTSTLPLSLQPILRSVWKLTSEEYRWSIS